MKQRRSNEVQRLLCGLLIGVSAMPAAGQAKKPGDAPPDSIVITALKRDEPLARTGAPVSVLPGDQLARTGSYSAERLEQQFPSLTVQPTSTGNLIFIRGVGNFTLQPNSDPAVGYVYDGVIISRPMGTLGQYFDLERIEVLKGPQGVLYGRNASAGSINVEPRQPELGRTFLLASASLSNLEARSEAAMNLSLGDTTALRIAGATFDQDALLEGYPEGPIQRSVRAQLKTKVSDGITVRLSGDYTHAGGVGLGTSYVGNYVFDSGSRAYRFIASGLPLSEGIYSPSSQRYRQSIVLAPLGRKLDAIGSVPRQDDEFFGLHARLDADTALGRLTVIPAWRKSAVDTIVSGSPFGFRQRESNRQASLEARLAGSARQWDWLGGMLLFRDRIRSDTVTNLSSMLVQTAQRYGTDSSAVFTTVTLHATERVRLSAGARWTEDRKRYTSASTSLTIGCTTIVANRPFCPTTPLFPLVESFAELPFAIPAQAGSSVPLLVNGAPTGAIVTRTAIDARDRLTDRALTWRLAGEFDVGTRSLLYGTVETGNRPGGFNTATGFETYDPERIIAYTVGLRHRDLGGRLQLDLEGFWWNYRDQQVSALRPDLSLPRPRNANITENVGNSRIRGIEADVHLLPWTGGQARAVVQYLDARYRSFRYVYANNGVPPLTGCPATLDRAANLYSVDCSSKQPYNSPRWSLNFELRQTFKVGRAELTASADTHYRSARNIGFAFLPQQRIGPTWTSNAEVSAAFPDTRVQFAAFVRNIEGRRIPQFMIYHPVSNALIAATTMPREVGLRASLRLN